MITGRLAPFSYLLGMSEEKESVPVSSNQEKRCAASGVVEHSANTVAAVIGAACSDPCVAIPAALCGSFIIMIRKAQEATRRKKALEYFQLLLNHSRFSSPEELLFEIEGAADNGKIAETIAEGFQKLQQLVDDAMKGPMVLLVSQEAWKTEYSTEYYRRTSRLLLDCTSEIALELRQVVGAVASVCRAHQAEEITSLEIHMSRGPVEGRHGLVFWSQATLRGVGDPVQSELEENVSHDNRAALEALLEQSSYARAIRGHTGFETHNARGLVGSTWLLISPERALWFVGLAECLKAVPD